MTPAMLALVMSLVEEAVKIAPSVATELKTIFSASNPSPADWEALRQKVLSQSYADYVPQSALSGTAASPAPDGAS